MDLEHFKFDPVPFDDAEYTHARVDELIQKEKLKVKSWRHIFHNGEWGVDGMSFSREGFTYHLWIGQPVPPPWIAALQDAHNRLVDIEENDEFSARFAMNTIAACLQHLYDAMWWHAILLDSERKPIALAVGALENTVTVHNIPIRRAIIHDVSNLEAALTSRHQPGRGDCTGLIAFTFKSLLMTTGANSFKLRNSGGIRSCSCYLVAARIARFGVYWSPSNITSVVNALVEGNLLEDDAPYMFYRPYSMYCMKNHKEINFITFVHNTVWTDCQTERDRFVSKRRKNCG